MEHARVNGVELAYEVSGTGAPVLLMGGTGMPAVGWQFSQAPALVAAGYRVVTFASRGVAPSEAPPPPYRIADMAADTAALMEHLQRHAGPKRQVVGRAVASLVVPGRHRRGVDAGWAAL